MKLKNAAEWIDTLKEWKGYETDAEASAFLDRAVQVVSSYRTGRTEMENMVCVQVGRALGVNPLFLIACAEYHRTKDPKKKALWAAAAKVIEPKEPNPKKKRSPGREG